MGFEPMISMYDILDIMINGSLLVENLQAIACIDCGGTLEHEIYYSATLAFNIYNYCILLENFTSNILKFIIDFFLAFPFSRYQ